MIRLEMSAPSNLELLKEINSETVSLVKGFLSKTKLGVRYDHGIEHLFPKYDHPLFGRLMESQPLFSEARSLDLPAVMESEPKELISEILSFHHGKSQSQF